MKRLSSNKFTTNATTELSYSVPVFVHLASGLHFTEYLDGPEQGHSPSKLETFDINFNLLLVKPTAGKTCFTETPTNKPIETQE